MFRKTRQGWLCILLLSLFTTRSTTTHAQAFSESFEDITTLPGKGWFLVNNSSPLGSTAWFQGTNLSANGPFDSYNGAANAYIGANFNNTTGSTGIINSWLVTPNRVFRNGDVLSFYTRKPATPSGGTDYPDRLEVRLSTNGASTNVGTPGNNVGDFTTLLMSVNPTLIGGGYPFIWTKYTVTISGLPAPTSGRIAFRYFVTAAGPSGFNSDYIGIDQVDYTPYVCPAFTIAPSLLPGGVAGLAYSQTLSQTGSLGAPNFAITAGALPPGLTLTSAGIISGTPTATGTFNFTVTVSDASGCSGTRSYSITTICSPINPIVINTPETICSNGGPLVLSASPAGGTFSGVGVVGSTFNPTVGTQTITYSYADPYGCHYEKSSVYEVSENIGTASALPSTQTVCGGLIQNIVPSSSISGTSFKWTRDNTDLVTGIAASGTGTISGSLTNTTTAPVLVTFTITQVIGDCDGPSTTATVLVGATPSLQVPATTIELSNSGSACTAIANYAAAVVTSGAPTPTLAYSFSGATTASGTGTGSGSAFNVGTTTVTITATNSCGTNSKSFDVVVSDVVPPVITEVPDPITVTSESAVPAPDVTLLTATDHCGAVTITHVSDVVSDQTCDDRYIITRTYKATDAAGLFVTATQTITVNDDVAPVISCPANITVTTPVGSCTADVTFEVTATDNSGRPVTITTSIESGSAFALGTTTVTATAVDACGNESSCTFTVTVLDGQLPVVSSLTTAAVCADQTATMSVTASNVVSYQWQVLVGNSWVNLTGATGATLELDGLVAEDNGTQLRVRLQGPCSTVFSDAITLTVYELPAPVITTADNICLDQRGVQLAAAPAGGTFEGRGVTGTTWNLEALPVGQHRIDYTYTDNNGCTSKTSKLINVDVCATEKVVMSLETYPNPTSGKVTLKAFVTEGTNWSVNVTNFNGTLVSTKRVPLREGWNTFQVDLTGQPGGVYIISLVQDGKRRTEVKVLKF